MKLALSLPNGRAWWVQNSLFIAFAFLTFSSFFGLNLPFQEKTMDAWEQEQSNPLNQFAYFFIFSLNLPVILFRYEEIWKFIRKEKWLGLLVLFFLLSFTWSDYGFISIKRSFQLFIMYITLINVWCFLNKKIIFLTIKIIVTIYIVITYLVSLTIPEAIDPSFNTWRGLTLQKNGLAQISFYIFLLSIFFQSVIKTTKYSWLNKIITALAILLIFLAQSSTVILALFFVIIAFLIFNFEKIFLKIGINKIVSIMILLLIALIIAILTIFSNELLAIIPAIFGKDLTFTGRTLIWDYVIGEILKRPLLGYGYMTYWIMGSSRLDIILVNQSHNSYLEIILWGGFLGFLLFCLFVFNFLKRAYLIKNDKLLISLISILIIGFSEGILFQARTITTFIIMFLYLFLFKEFISAIKSQEIRKS